MVKYLFFLLGNSTPSAKDNNNNIIVEPHTTDVVPHTSINWYVVLPMVCSRMFQPLKVRTKECIEDVIT